MFKLNILTSITCGLSIGARRQQTNPLALFLSFQNLEKVDEGEVLEASGDERDNSDIEDSGDSSAGDIEEDDDDDDDVNPLLVDPDRETDEATKTKLWFDKVR